MSKRQSRERVPLHDVGAGTALRQPLRGLDALRDRVPPGPATTPPGEPAPAPSDAPPAGPRTVFGRAPRLVVRRERKGHGGKTWTRIEGLLGSTVEIEAALRELKRTLGCGATRDGNDVLIQGAQGERIVAFLNAHGARKVVVGS